MKSVYDFIDDKRKGLTAAKEDIDDFVRKVVSGEAKDYQIAAWLMAVCINGMTDEETAELTFAMEKSGDEMSLGLPYFCVDKHSTGGVGDKVTLFCAPVCASLGIFVPKMSGRGLGYTGGTIDKLESIPGFTTSLTEEKFKDTVLKAGFAVGSQTGECVPADKIMYALRNATATVESIPLIASSIMSKKLATGADALVLDVKTGDGAFMKNEDDATELARLMLEIARIKGKKATAVITDMNKPLGKAVGNSLEVIEAIEALKGNFDDDFKEVAYRITAEMLCLSGMYTLDEAMEATDAAVKSRTGIALKAFEKMIACQGGNTDILYDYSLLPKAAREFHIISEKDGFIKNISCEKTGKTSLILGAGRKTKNDIIDPAAGIVFNKKCGDYVKKGEELAVLYTSKSDDDLQFTAKDFLTAFEFCDEEVKTRKNVIKVMRNY